MKNSHLAIITITITAVFLLTAHDSNLPPSQVSFSARVADLRTAVERADDSGNALSVNKAEAAAITFLRETEHQADKWLASVDSVESHGDETWIKAEQGELKFCLRIADPKLKAWAESRVRGDEIEFDGNLGRERSLTLSGGLDEPEFTFWPRRIRLMKEAASQEQDAQILYKASLREKQRIYDSEAEMVTAAACQEAALARLTLPDQASFSWLQQSVTKTGADVWTYNSTVDAKNLMGATIVYQLICNAKVTEGVNGEPNAKVSAITLR